MGQNPALARREAGSNRKAQKAFEEAPLWAYDGRAGRQHFQKLCASCHVLGQDGNRIGPELTGSNANGISTFLKTSSTRTP